MSDAPTTIVIEIPPPSDVCPTCGARYQHIQHPMKPPSVIMMSVCECPVVLPMTSIEFSKP